jgi:sialate O-acetylesterase
MFASDMVLQAERSSIHGHAMPGAKVTLTASPARAGFPATTLVGDDGVWAAPFDEQVSNLTPTNITITSGAGTVMLSKVLWGDVILCSGQSNMGVPTSYILNSTAVIAAAAELTRSVRLIRVASGSAWCSVLKRIVHSRMRIRMALSAHDSVGLNAS